MVRHFMFKNGFESGKDDDKIYFCVQVNIGIQGIDNSVVNSFMNAVSSEFNRIQNQTILIDMGGTE